MKIRKYKYSTCEGKICCEEILPKGIEKHLKDFAVLIFRLINYKHCFLKDDRGRLIVKNIIEIEGLRSCFYEDSWGQRIHGIFMIKIGKFLI